MLSYHCLNRVFQIQGRWQLSGRSTWQCVCLKFIFCWVSEMKMSDMSKSLHRKEALEKQRLQLIKTKIPLVSSKSPLFQPHLCPWLGLLMTDTVTKQTSLWLSSIVHLMLPGQFHSLWSPYQCLPNEVSLPIEYGMWTTSFQGTLWEELIFSLF